MATKEGELDQELMKAVARGQQQALEKLMDRHGGKVRGICKRILPKYPADQDDCYND
jgi:DNA-directed RNA polymerase specialized sigma24 family protein